jgi:hypothetical protein
MYSKHQELSNKSNNDKNEVWKSWKVFIKPE